MTAGAATDCCCLDQVGRIQLPFRSTVSTITVSASLYLPTQSTCCLTVSPSVSPSVSLAVHLSHHLSHCLSICPSIRLPDSLAVHLSHHLSISQSICLSVSLPPSLFVASCISRFVPLMLILSMILSLASYICTDPYPIDSFFARCKGLMYCMYYRRCLGGCQTCCRQSTVHGSSSSGSA